MIGRPSNLGTIDSDVVVDAPLNRPRRRSWLVFYGGELSRVSRHAASAAAIAAGRSFARFCHPDLLIGLSVAVRSGSVTGEWFQ